MSYRNIPDSKDVILEALNSSSFDVVTDAKGNIVF
jgi:hypothetical protein